MNLTSIKDNYETISDKSYSRTLSKDPNLNVNSQFVSSEVNNLSVVCHAAAALNGWWTDIETGEYKARNKPEMFMLMVSEIAEAMEGVRKNLDDNHLPHRKSEEVELADTLIRIFDYAGRYGLDLGGAMVEKLEYNDTRADHKIENRLKADGKKF